MQGWLELAVTVPAEAIDAVGNHLIEMGAPGLIEEEVAGAPDRARLRAHFPEAIERPIPDEVRSFLASLERVFPGCATSPVEVSRVAPEDWAEGWKRDFPPLEIGRSIRVRPPWSPPAKDGRHDVEILPAMAFGTGQHASTLGCLLALEDLAARGADLSSVLDVGTGSGILAIVAARLGAGRVVAIDDDPLAIEAALENVRRNGVDGIVAVRETTVEAVSGSFALILANLFANLLRSLFPAFASVAARRGTLVVAGLLDEDRHAVSAAAEASGWRESLARAVDGWTTLVFRRGA